MRLGIDRVNLSGGLRDYRRHQARRKREQAARTAMIISDIVRMTAYTVFPVQLFSNIILFRLPKDCGLMQIHARIPDDVKIAARQMRHCDSIPDPRWAAGRGISRHLHAVEWQCAQEQVGLLRGTALAI